ncbi:mechanosensitive ion channel family protein [Altererythrobacter aquiaggeris]|uniref:mechanosensitive ion channel family protein n=1 Tax=Aestuarierythrobacter aquiaggeris TaxID=1898396 RepID=UPI0030163F90
MSTSAATPSASPAPQETSAGDTLQAGDTVTLQPVEGDAPAVQPAPAPVETEAVKSADSIKDAVSEKSETAAGLIETLDGLAINFGSTRISAWDSVVVVLVIAGVIAGAWLLSKFAHSILKRITKFDSTQQLLAEKLVTMGVWALAVMIGIDMLGIDLTALAVFSGAFGLAIGFGLQKTFGNLIAGIILLMDRSIKPGDVIAVSDQAGNSTFGQIRKIGIRAVSVTTRDQREYLIPNENLMVNQVENWSYSSKTVRMQVPVGVAYGCDIKVAEKLMLEAAGSVSRILKVPAPKVWLDAYGDSSVNFIIQCWIRDPEDGVGNIKSAVLKTLWQLFQENKIEIPFPQRDLNLRSNEQFDQLIAAVSQRVDQKKSGG